MGKFQKGVSGNPTGRPKGALNKSTTKIREAFTKLVEENIDNMTLWLERVAKDNPREALNIISNLSEYTVPKLSRVEQEISSAVDNEINISIKRNKEEDK